MYETVKAQYPNLPTLIGTPKQVAWASSLRLKAISDAQQDFLSLIRKYDWIEGLLRRIRDIGEEALAAELATKAIKAPPEVAVTQAAQVTSAIKRLNEALTQTEATWFITNRKRYDHRDGR